jgi:hypothetical protein
VRKAIDCRLGGVFTDATQAVNYVTSHDVEGFRHERLFTMLRSMSDEQIEKRIKLAFVCLMTAVGIPMFLAGFDCRPAGFPWPGGGQQASLCSTLNRGRCSTPGHGKQTLAALLDGLIAPGLRSPRKQEIGGHGSCPATVGRIQSERRVSVERIGTALIEAAAMRCGPGGDASRAAFRRPCSVKPGGDTAHDYGASTAEWCTVRPGD